jgi:predicted MFS family arabinose efflux permease
LKGVSLSQSGIPAEEDCVASGESQSVTIPDEVLPPTISPRGFPDEVVIPQSVAEELASQSVGVDQGAWPQSLRALRNHDFRLFCGGNFLSNIGTWMQNIAQGWLVLQLTNSPFWLGLVGFAAAIPFLLFTLFGGVIADRVNKRYLLVSTQSAMMLLAFAMATLAYLKIITIKQVIVLSFLNGVAMALNAPSYQALVPQLVTSGDLPNAIALNSAQFHLSRVLGPTLGGYAMAWFGVAGNFFLNAFSFLALLIALLRIRYPASRARSHGSFWRSLKEGFSYVRQDGVMAVLVALVASASLLLFPFLTFVPFFVKNSLHAGARGLGLIMAFSGIGAFMAAATIAFVGRVRYRGPVVVFSGVFVMVAVIVFCYSHSFALSAAMSLCEGYGLTITASTMNLALQQLTSDAMRGRVMSIYATSFMGLPPVGCLLAGELSRHMPTTHAIAAMSALALVSFLAFFWRSAALRELD